MSIPAQQILVCSKTVVQASNGLFDFNVSSSAQQSRSYPVHFAGACMKTGDQIDCVSMEAPACEGSRALFKFERRGEQLEFSPAKAPAGAWRPWIVVRESQTAKIDVGDEILMGRASLTVVQAVVDERRPETPKAWNGTVCESCDLAAAQGMQCRICLMEGASQEDPFVQPCRCSGSVGHVHLGCLRRWTKTRLNLPETPVDSFVYKTPICEMCRADYPALVSTGKKMEPLVDSLPQVQAPYIVLRSSTTAKSGPKEAQTAFHVVSFAKSLEAKVGRGEEAKVRLDVATMSRWHATITFKDGEFVVQDNASKFGTLLAMQKPWTAGPEQALSVKVGRSVFSFALPSETLCTAEPSEVESPREEDRRSDKTTMARTTTQDA